MRRCVGLAIFSILRFCDFCDFGAAGENFCDFGCFCTRENALLRPKSDVRARTHRGVGDLAAESRNSHYAPPLTSRAPVSFDYLKTPSLFWEKYTKSYTYRIFGPGSRIFLQNPGLPRVDLNLNLIKCTSFPPPPRYT